MEQFVFVSWLVFLWLVSPDSDFIIVVKKGLVYSYKKAFFVILGIACATLFHILYIAMALEFIANQIVIIKYLGVIYFLYIGFKGLFAKKNDMFLSLDNLSVDISNFKAFKAGFINDALNANTIIFFIGLFSIFINKETSNFEIVLYAMMVFLQSIIWYSFVAFCFSRHSIKRKFQQVQFIQESL